ncbi:MAG: hypothetical protein KA146_02235 [Leptospiraceae bacterium]|nr:hypothetical protein [Leptospiraceae bacterium]
MKEIKLKDIPIKTLDGKPLVVGMKVFRSEINTPYQKSMTLETREWTVEYVNTVGRTYMVRDLSKGFEHRFSSGKCHFYSSVEASKKELKKEISELIRENELKIKYRNANLKFLRSL